MNYGYSDYEIWRVTGPFGEARWGGWGVHVDLADGRRFCQRKAPLSDPEGSAAWEAAKRMVERGEESEFLVPVDHPTSIWSGCK